MSATRTLRNAPVRLGSGGVVRATVGLSSVGPPPTLRISHVFAAFMMTGSDELVALQLLQSGRRPEVEEVPRPVVERAHPPSGDEGRHDRCLQPDRPRCEAEWGHDDRVSSSSRRVLLPRQAPLRCPGHGPGRTLYFRWVTPGAS